VTVKIKHTFVCLHHFLEFYELTDKFLKIRMIMIMMMKMLIMMMMNDVNDDDETFKILDDGI
jgi:hypothetical protein